MFSLGNAGALNDVVKEGRLMSALTNAMNGRTDARFPPDQDARIAALRERIGPDHAKILEVLLVRMEPSKINGFLSYMERISLVQAQGVIASIVREFERYQQRQQRQQRLMLQ